MDTGRNETQRDTGRTSVAIVAEESDDGAYEIHVTASADEPAAPASDVERATLDPGDPEAPATRGKWPLLAVALLIVAAVVFAVGVTGSDEPQARDSTSVAVEESPTFRAWIVPADPDPAQRSAVGEQPAEPAWQGEPQVAGVVYRGPDVEGDEETAEEAPVRIEALHAPSGDRAQRPVIDTEPARLPERWAPAEPVQIDPAMRSRLERVPILTVESDELEDEFVDDEEWEDEDDGLDEEEYVDEEYLEDDERLDDELNEGWED